MLDAGLMAMHGAPQVYKLALFLRVHINAYKGLLKKMFISVPQGADPPPLPQKRRKAVRNHMNWEIIPLLPTGIGERLSQTISNFEHAALLRRCELPL
jgi:hypothetical protein